MDWLRAYNLLFPLINNTSDDAYFSGPRFINIIRELDSSFPDYAQFIEQRKAKGLSTSRRKYFYDILDSQNESIKYKAFEYIINEIIDIKPDAKNILTSLQDVSQISSARVDSEYWNSERLNTSIQSIDKSITEKEYSRAITLAYTSLEGFYKTFLRQHLPENEKTEIIAMSKEIKLFLTSNSENLPDEVVKIVNHITHTIDRTRNRHSEAHFDVEANHILATYMRDLVNANIRFLLNFM